MKAGRGGLQQAQLDREAKGIVEQKGAKMHVNEKSLPNLRYIINNIMK